MNDLNQTGMFPKHIYEFLPATLKYGLDFYEDDRAKDIFLLSALTTASGCLPRLSGIYHTKRVYPNLFTLILAPPASGKEPVEHAGSLGDDIHEYLKSLPKSGKFRPGLFIPGNSSAAAILNILDSYPYSNGIIVETEADSLGTALDQDWGNFSDILRKSYHHEMVSSARMKEDDIIEVYKPRLSMLLTGTPEQMKSIINSVSNGLFSRFMFYAFAVPLTWKDVTPKKGKDYESYFTPVREAFLKMYNIFNSADFDFILSDAQWTNLNDKFSPLLSNIVNIAGEEASSVVKRLGLIAFRLCMVLSALRCIEKPESEEIVCNDIDFNIALDLIEILMQHSLIVFKSSSESLSLESKIEHLYRVLPDGWFKRNDAILIASAIGIKERTADKYLKELCDDPNINLHKPNHNEYFKGDVQNLQSEQTSEIPAE